MNELIPTDPKLCLEAGQLTYFRFDVEVQGKKVLRDQLGIGILVREGFISTSWEIEGLYPAALFKNQTIEVEISQLESMDALTLEELIAKVKYEGMACVEIIQMLERAHVIKKAVPPDPAPLIEPTPEVETPKPTT